MFGLCKLPDDALRRLANESARHAAYYTRGLARLRAKGLDDLAIAAAAKALSELADLCVAERACRAGPRCTNQRKTKPPAD